MVVVMATNGDGDGVAADVDDEADVDDDISNSAMSRSFGRSIASQLHHSTAARNFKRMVWPVTGPFGAHTCRIGVMHCASGKKPTEDDTIMHVRNAST